MKVQLTALLLLAPSVSASDIGAQQQSPAPAAGSTDTGWGFTIDLGSDLIMRKRPPGPDFEIYDVAQPSDTAQVLFSVYAGNHPRMRDPHGAEELRGALRDLPPAAAARADRAIATIASAGP